MILEGKPFSHDLTINFSLVSISIWKYRVGVPASFATVNDFLIILFPNIVVVTREAWMSKIMSLDYNRVVKNVQKTRLTTNCSCLVNVKGFYMMVLESYCLGKTLSSNTY